MKESKIRLARKEDAKAIEDMIFDWSSLQWPEWLPERTKAILKVLENPNHLVLVSEINEEIAGLLHLIFYSDIFLGSSIFHLNLLSGKEKYRCASIGSKLLNEKASRAKKEARLKCM